MSLFNALSASVLIVFLTGGPILIIFRRVLLGSALMCAAALVPVFAQFTLTDSDSPATVMVAALLLPVPSLIFFGRLTYLAIQWIKDQRQRAEAKN